VLFFGRHGTGTCCYGEGTSNQALDNTLTSDGITKYCYDPRSNWKGEHAYPYSHYVWAYDANDLAAAKAGTKHPWDVRPYAVWSLNLPNEVPGYAYAMSATYDPATGSVYVAQQLGDGVYPLVHVYTVHVP
jgi:hypothetical protein